MSDEVAARAARPDLSDTPLYQDFFEHHEEYARIHIHLVGLVSSSRDTAALDKRRNRFGRPRVVDAVADPFVTVQTLGADTGSSDHFPIGKHTFPTLTDCQTPVWDSKCLLISKKNALEGIQFTLWDDNTKAADEALMTIVVAKEELRRSFPRDGKCLENIFQVFENERCSYAECSFGVFHHDYRGKRSHRFRRRFKRHLQQPRWRRVFSSSLARYHNV